jgi:presenilin-like A22 family membrane protease
VRFAAVTFAFILLLYRRDWIERAAFLCAIVAAGSSALFGLGFRSTILDIVRLLFHFVAYALGFAASVRWLIRQSRNSQPSFVAR